MNRVAGEHAALEREHQAAAENRIEKTKRVAHEQQPLAAAVARVKAVLARQKIIAHLPPHAQVILDPQILADLALENRPRIFHAAAREIFALRHDAHAHPVVVLRDVPEPALLRQHRHGGLALVDARLAFRALVVSPHRELVQIRIFHAPAIAHRAETFLARAIERHRRAQLDNLTGFFLRPHPGHAPVLAQQFLHGNLLDDLRPAFARVLHQHQIKLAAQHLPRRSDRLAVVAVEKIKRLARLPVRLHELHAEFLLKTRCLHLRHEAEPLHRPVAKGDQRFANVVARKFLALEHEHAMTVLRENARRRTPRRTAADDENVVVR